MAVAVGVACGGSSTNGTSGTTGSTGSSGTATGSSGTTTGTATGATGTTGTTGATTGTSTSGTGGGVTDSGMIVNDTIPCPPTSTTLSCPTSQFCCQTPGTGMGMMGGGAPTYACVATAAACSGTGQTVTQCASAAQCGSQICCREPVAMGDAAGGGRGGLAVNDVCETSCPTGSTQLCSGTGTGECANGGTCANGRCQPPPCTSTSCTSPEICCAGGGGNPACTMPNTAGACPNGAKVCSADSDCSTDQTCNAPAMGNGAKTCVAKSCTAKTDCTSPDLCCAGGGGGATCVAATMAGACPNGGAAVCAADSDCTAPDTCQPTANNFGGADAAPGPMTCQAPTCTAASATNAMPCASGSICCAGFGGGAARCATPSMTGGCAGGQTPVCLVDSDCTGGLVCRTGGGMNGTLGCRAPLDAGTTTPPTMDAAVTD